jgi:hypothetical protein
MKAALIKVVLALVVAVPAYAQQSSAQAAHVQPFNGDWTVTFSCEGATGVYAERCKDGIRDSFVIAGLTQVEDRICGHHMASIQLGNKVDENGSVEMPSVEGVIDGGVAHVVFRTAADQEGKALMEIKEGMLYWKIIQGPEMSILPKVAILTRVKDSNYKPTKCLPLPPLR